MKLFHELKLGLNALICRVEGPTGSVEVSTGYFVPSREFAKDWNTMKVTKVAILVSMRICKGSDGDNA